MPRLGKDVSTLFLENNRKMPLQTVFRLAIQMVSLWNYFVRIQTIQQYNWIGYFHYSFLSTSTSTNVDMCMLTSKAVTSCLAMQTKVNHTWLTLAVQHVMRAENTNPNQKNFIMAHLNILPWMRIWYLYWLNIFVRIYTDWMMECFRTAGRPYNAWGFTDIGLQFGSMGWCYVAMGIRFWPRWNTTIEKGFGVQYGFVE